MYFDVYFNVFFKLIKVHLLVSELYMHHLVSNCDICLSDTKLGKDPQFYIQVNML